MKFNDEYQEYVCLPGGAHVNLRLVQPRDKERLRSGFLNLSAVSRQKRFFGGKQSLSDAELRYFTELDHSDHFAIGAVELNSVGEEGEGVGIGRFIRTPEDAECAEVALTVIDRMQGRGIGHALLERLIDAAAERGIERFRCECLPYNIEIKKLVQKVCKVVEFKNDAGALIAEVELPRRHRDSPERAVDTFAGLYKLLRTFAAGAVELQIRIGIGAAQRFFDIAFSKQSLGAGK